MRFDEFKMRARSTQIYPGYVGTLFSRISIGPSYLLAHTSVTPNQLTLISTFLAFGAVGLLQSGVYTFRLTGLVVWFLAYVLDFSDGDIARYKNMKSEFGHWFEAVSDRAKDVALLSTLTYFVFNQLHLTWLIWTGCLALGGTLLHSYMITYGFKRYTRFTHSLLSPFEGVNKALLAVFVILNYVQVYLLVVALTSLSAVAFNVYSTWQGRRHQELR